MTNEPTEGVPSSDPDPADSQPSDRIARIIEAYLVELDQAIAQRDFVKVGSLAGSVLLIDPTNREAAAALALAPPPVPVVMEKASFLRRAGGYLVIGWAVIVAVIYAWGGLGLGWPFALIGIGCGIWSAEAVGNRGGSKILGFSLGFGFLLVGVGIAYLISVDNAIGRTWRWFCDHPIEALFTIGGFAYLPFRIVYDNNLLNTFTTPSIILVAIALGYWWKRKADQQQSKTRFRPLKGLLLIAAGMLLYGIWAFGPTMVAPSYTAWAPAWSPDGKRIAFVGTLDGLDQIFVMDVDGSHLQRLTDNNTHNNNPAWSPDGKRIAFARGKPSAYGIFVMDADGSHVQQLTHNKKFDSDPAWSPDGKRIAFVNDPYGDSEIFVMDADGSHVRQLTHNNKQNGYPAWSPDGKRIAFMSTHRIFVMDADGSHIVGTSSQGWLPSWR